MPLGIMGKKLGMTNIFTEDGRSIPVTVVQVEPNRVSQIKTTDRDDYAAVQLAVGEQHPARITKAEAGHLAKAGVEPARALVEFKVSNKSDLESLNLGDEITVDQFEPNTKVDVRGTTQGKGFAGTIKKYNFNRQPATHGAATVHRKPGSIGQCQTPGRVFKGKKMPGQMGNKNNTVQNLEVVQIDQDKNVILLKGACPGSKNSYITITPAVKARGQ